MEDIPVVDISSFLEDSSSSSATEAARMVVSMLKTYSCLIIRDPRVSMERNDIFRSMMCRYYAQSEEEKAKDTRPELSFQVGATPEGTEVPRDHSKTIASLKSGQEATIPTGPDPKWRFFWQMSRARDLPPVVPSAFDQWETVMNDWGRHMVDAILSVSELMALGFGLPKHSFRSYLESGPHLLAPTGVDLNKYGTKDTVIAGFHYDIGFLTIHGKSNYPGLYIWLKDGRKMRVKVPDGCLLLQVGKQLEWVTGGVLAAGFHEVVVKEPTLQKVQENKEKGKDTAADLWRVSSTLFSHVANDKILQPLEAFADAPSAKEAREQVQEELSAISLAKA